MSLELLDWVMSVSNRRSASSAMPSSAQVVAWTLWLRGQVDVAAGGYTAVTIAFDTGIR